MTGGIRFCRCSLAHRPYQRWIDARRWTEVAHSERFELPTLGIEIRCSIQLSYERINKFNNLTAALNFLADLLPLRSGAGRQLAEPNSHLARIFSSWLCVTRFSDLGGTERQFSC